MKVNKLAKLSNIHPETIRMYRQLGLLSPHQQANGYYDYSIADFSRLIYLRKLREYGMSLDDIRIYESSVAPDVMVNMLEEEEDTLARQIARLKDMQRFLRLEKRHVIESNQVGKESVQVMQSVDEKIDFYGDEVIFEALGELDFNDFYLTSTTCLHISKEVLNGPVEDRVIPLQAGIGMYRYMADRLQISIPEKATIVPNGKCISQMLSLRNCEEVNIKQLAPMIEYAKKIQQPFCSDTTAYLARIHHDENGTIFDFRIRACIEENDIKDPETLEQA